jgi:hypothetical protein
VVAERSLDNTQRGAISGDSVGSVSDNRSSDCRVTVKVTVDSFSVVWCGVVCLWKKAVCQHKDN